MYDYEKATTTISLRDFDLLREKAGDFMAYRNQLRRAMKVESEVGSTEEIPQITVVLNKHKLEKFFLDHILCEEDDLLFSDDVEFVFE